MLVPASLVHECTVFQGFSFKHGCRRCLPLSFEDKDELTRVGGKHGDAIGESRDGIRLVHCLLPNKSLLVSSPKSTLGVRSIAGDNELPPVVIVWHVRNGISFYFIFVFVFVSGDLAIIW